MDADADAKGYAWRFTYDESVDQSGQPLMQWVQLEKAVKADEVFF